MRNICTIIVHFRQLLQIKRKRDLFRKEFESSFRAAKSQTFFIFFCKFYRRKFSLASAISTAHWDKVLPYTCGASSISKIYVCNNLNHIDQNATHKQSLQFFFPVITINFIFINKITIFDIIELQYLTIFFQNTAERYKS